MLPFAPRTIRGWVLLWLLCPAALLLPAGCAAVGFVAHALPPPVVEAQYTGLAGQRIAVMVWADRAIRIDWPNLGLDTTGAIQNKLISAGGKKMPLEGASFPWSPASVARYQEEHPESEFDPIEKTAAKLGVSRVVYVEIEQFATRTEATTEMFRGTATASVKVVEVAGETGHVAYEESNIQVSFPPKVGPEGTFRGNDNLMYRGTIEVLAQRISDRFIPHQDED